MGLGILMISRSGIPEALVGSIALGLALWLFPTALSLQQLIIVTHPGDPLWQLAGAGIILILGTYLCIGVFLSLLVVESFTIRLYTFLKSYMEFRRKDTL